MKYKTKVTNDIGEEMVKPEAVGKARIIRGDGVPKSTEQIPLSMENILLPSTVY